MADACDNSILSSEDSQQLLSLTKRALISNDANDTAQILFAFSQIVVRYQEQPQLLDPILEPLIRPLANTLLTHIPNDIQPHVDREIITTSKLLWQIASVRGYKTVIQFLPNDVAAFEPVVRLLQILKQAGTVVVDTDGESIWEAQYVTLMWLSMLALVPFDILVIDSTLSTTTLTSSSSPSTTTNNNSQSEAKTESSQQQCPPIVTVIMNICKQQLATPTAGRDMAAVVLGRLLTRPDMKSELNNFLDWGFEALKVEGFEATFLLPGVASALATILKLGRKEVLLAVSPKVLAAAIDLLHSSSAKSNSLLRKLGVKLIQRATLIMLPVQLASWRYRRTEHTLMSSTPNTLPTQTNTQQPLNTTATTAWDPNSDAAEHTETSIGELLSTLSDKDTVVRWSAAKGIARIVERLPQDLGDEVIGAVLDSLSTLAAGDGAWHGGCLSLAELIRRGLLLPERLSETVTVILKALEYDVRRGPCSIGAHVRDAGAFVCWAIARAYHKEDLGETVSQIAPALICLACYDREVNCRRAAAAAFQECVGRLGSFMYGIDIVTAADYFTVSVRHNAYLKVAPTVASFPGYLPYFIHHLTHSKLSHWEKTTRELTAKAIAALTPLNTKLITDDVLPFILSNVTNPSVELRHGSVATIAELLPVLQSCKVVLDAQRIHDIGDVVPAIHRQHFSKGKGGEIMRGALCNLAESMASTAVELSQEQKEVVFSTIMDNLEHSSPEIQLAAAQALTAYTAQYLKEPPEKKSVELIQTLITVLHTAPVPTARRGAALALGRLPPWALEPQKWLVLEALTSSFTSSSSGSTNSSGSGGIQDVETRTNAVKAVAEVVSSAFTSSTTSNSIQEDIVEWERLKSTVILPLLRALDDYTADNRGDVGSWVREAAMNSLSCIFTLLSSTTTSKTSTVVVDSDDGQIQNQTLLPIQLEQVALVALQAMLKQSVERIGKLREIAAVNIKTLAPLLSSSSSSSNQLDSAAVAAAAVTTTFYACDTEAFSGVKALPSIATLIAHKPLSPALIEGFAFSIGGLDAQLSEAAADALADAVSALDMDINNSTSSPANPSTGDGYIGDIADIGEVLLSVWSKHGRSGRMCTPLLLLADVLMARTPLADLGPSTGNSDFPSRLLGVVKSEVVGCTDVPRLKAAASVVCQLVGTVEPEWRQDAVETAVSLIGNKYPKVRRHAAEQLYTALLACDAEEQEGWNVERAMEVLEETAWDGVADVVRPARALLLECLSVPQVAVTVAP